MPRSAREAIAIARATEQAGFWGFGVSDSPYLYGELYPVVTACLEATSSIHIGPNVTNPVSRNWSTHAAAARTFDELYPGRYFLGIATGDGAVYSVGLQPAKPAALEEAVRTIRKHGPERLEVQVAASGGRSLAVAGRTADGVILGTGFDGPAIQTLSAIAQRARLDASIAAPLERWALVELNVVASEAEIPAARKAFEPVAVAYSRFAFDFTFEGKNVPEVFWATMRERYARYQHHHHAQLKDDNPNSDLFADDPAIRDYLIDRFCVVGTREQCANRVAALIDETKVDGIWMSVVVPDPVGVVHRAAEALAFLTS
jgi:alkanesulfonate monooxygenase SsuD/methylene tetrahydromethanopterin reductase-like flavin-dependent oxidoreductase (luciferase family)